MRALGRVLKSLGHQEQTHGKVKVAVTIEIRHLERGMVDWACRLAVE